jgi:hypothetical protein
MVLQQRRAVDPPDLVVPPMDDLVQQYDQNRLGPLPSHLAHTRRPRKRPTVNAAPSSAPGKKRLLKKG